MKLVNLGILVQVLFLIIFAAGASHGSSLKPSLPSSSPAKYPYRGIKKQLDDMINRELGPYTVASIKVVSLKSGSTLYEKNPYLLVAPASLQKLFTAAAALSRLGPDYIIETSIAGSADDGSLYVKGCGDPLLKTADLTRMVGDLAGKLAPGRQYRLVGDTGCIDDEYWGNGWMWDDEPAPDAMYLSALSVNGNTVGVTAAPGKDGSTTLDITTDPSTRYMNIESSATTGKAGGPCAVSVTRTAGERDNLIRVSGSLAGDCRPVSKRLSVWRPELYTLTLLAELLERSGIKTAALTTGVSPPDSVKLAATQRRVSDIILEVLKNSDNLSAENLLKHLAYKKTGNKGTAADGAEAVKEYLRKNGIPAERLVIADGSGVSRYNLNNADTVTRLLVAVYRDQAVFPIFENALSFAGIDGTLAVRMKGTAATGRVKAKTGSMKGISALAGYTVTADGEPLAFSMIMQNFTGSGQRFRDLQDRISVFLSTLTAGSIRQ